MTRKHTAFSLLLLLAATSTAIPTSPNILVPRIEQSKCGADEEKCASSLPNNFCCPEDFTCTPLAGNTTAVCCPPGSDCSRISPITCNIKQQDPGLNPKAPVKTSIFDVELEKCGTAGCCPFGYSCYDGKECRMDADQDKKPGNGDEDDSSTSATEIDTTTTVSETGLMTETELPLITSSPDEQDSGSDQNTDDDNAEDPGPDTTTIIGGVVGGVAALLALAVIIFVCARRRANKPTNPSPPASQGAKATPKGLNISMPISEQNSYRTDFARKNKTLSVSSMGEVEQGQMMVQRHNSVHPRISTVSLNNPFQEPSPTSPLPSQRYSNGSDYDVTNGRVVGGRLAPIRAMKPSSASSSLYGRSLTPASASRSRGGSEEDDRRSINIDVFADPVTVDGRGRQPSTMTTFSGMMDQIKARERGSPPAMPAKFI